MDDLEGKVGIGGQFDFGQLFDQKSIFCQKCDFFSNICNLGFCNVVLDVQNVNWTFE